MTAGEPSNNDALATGGRERVMSELQAGRVDSAYELLRQELAHSTDLEALNDLAVLSYYRGQVDDAGTILRTVLAIEPGRPDAIKNAATLGINSTDWRAADDLGGLDPGMHERAFPGMPRPDTLSEHCSRYAFAVGLVGAADALDLGCGTGYGSEMLSWSAKTVRGYDIWEPGEQSRPHWPGVAELNYGHDLCVDTLPAADVAVMFEVIEHLPDAPRALTLAWQAVPTIIGSFPNPVHHGSWMNQFHVNDWSLEQFESQLKHSAHAASRPEPVLTHFHQKLGSPLLTPGRDPDSSYWIVVATAGDGNAAVGGRTPHVASP